MGKIFAKYLSVFYRMWQKVTFDIILSWIYLISVLSFSYHIHALRYMYSEAFTYTSVAFYIILLLVLVYFLFLFKKKIGAIWRIWCVFWIITLLVLLIFPMLESYLINYWYNYRQLNQC